jgi:phage terminase large subunit-like protein
MSSITHLVDTWSGMEPAAWAGHRYGWIMADGQPIILTPWQRVILSEYWRRRSDVSTLFVSTVKKSGKTLLDSLLLAYRWLTIPSVHFAVGNDQDQSAELQTTMISAMALRHPILSRHVKTSRNELTFEPTGSRIIALPMDYRGASGANFATVSITELWAFEYETARRLYEELTPVPGDCLRIVDSYAGFEGEGDTLKMLWDRGLSGQQVNDEWPITMTGRQLSYIHQGEDAQARCWRGTEVERLAYYTEQRATLREGTYRRLHLNEWASAEDVFITADLWDSLIDPAHACPAPGDHVTLTVGLDASVKHDHTAAVSVCQAGERVALGPYRIWKPPIDLEAVESYIADLARRYRVAAVVYDPYQLAHLSQRLDRAGVRMQEWPQTVSNMTEAGNTFYDLIRQGRLVVYPGADDLRAHVLAAAAKETPRGIRLVKSESGRKIDAGIALAMACAVVNESQVYDLEMTVNPFFPELGGETVDEQLARLRVNELRAQAKRRLKEKWLIQRQSNPSEVTR